jgi:hypothetical protein
MSERTLAEERAIDTNISTATLAGATVAGVDERSGAERDAERNTIADGRDRMARSGATTEQTSAAAEDSSAPLFPTAEATELRSRWDSVQVGFVDEPRRAVEQADALVAAAMKRLAEIFAEERARLEGQWDRGDSVSTEDLRLALRRYRSFFGRVLSV